MMLDEESKEAWKDPQTGTSEVNAFPESPGEEKGVVESDSAIITDGEDRINFFVRLLVACGSISDLLFGAF